MSGLLDHEPCRIIRQAIIDVIGEGVGTAGNAQWRVFYDREPDGPRGKVNDNIITVIGTQGRDNGRNHNDGEREEQHGIQIIVRTNDSLAGAKKARDIAVKLDKNVKWSSVTIGSATYRIWSVNRTSAVLPLGKDEDGRYRFSINAVVPLEQTA